MLWDYLIYVIYGTLTLLNTFIVLGIWETALSIKSKRRRKNIEERQQ